MKRSSIALREARYEGLPQDKCLKIERLVTKNFLLDVLVWMLCDKYECNHAEALLRVELMKKAFDKEQKKISSE